MSSSGELHPKIALCICTCRRPDGLRRALDGIAALDFGGELHVIVVDNHTDQAGAQVCAVMAPSYRFSLVCKAEPIPGISAARNTALEEALRLDVDFVAMIDDDEWPAPDWLTTLISCQHDSNADIVYGSVVGKFEVPPPAWAIENPYFSRKAIPHTSNVLYRTDMLRAHGAPWFDRRLSFVGGEDVFFHQALTSARYRWAACDAARVYEYVPASRVSAAYIWSRNVRCGNCDTLIERAALPRRQWGVGRLPTAFAKIGYGLNHLFWTPLHRHRFYSAVEDGAQALGILLAECGLLYGHYATEHGLPRLAIAPRLAPSRNFPNRPPAPERPSVELAVTSAPSVRVASAKLRVCCYDNWGDFDDALAFSTPGGTGVWGDVAFVRSGVRPADWFGIFNQASHESVRIEASPNRVFFAIGEPPLKALRPLHLGQGKDTVVFTTDPDLRRDSRNPRRYILAPAMMRSWSMRRSIDDLRNSRVEEKPRQLSWITSNLRLHEGHAYRLAFLARLREKVDFDLYGRGYNAIGDKWEALAPYRYSIAFENFSSPYYFSEKLMDCFVAETMPLYFGSKSIAQYFPADSMVVIDPEDPDVFAKIKDVVRSDLWSRRKDAISEAKRLVLEKYNLFARLADFVSGSTDAPMAIRPMLINPVFPKWK